ncbi:hypothetical protein ARMGADRAFT_1007634 [Armillaria gallica]|uniref:Uncharacterized protein n=1 Tax=Armillaria gallica TaxID=47427 RepID=A0A2H3E764_ARMGA|nr:hypothetical protein ARMGADRAFT_1007634 [Armillaria gallica]
MVDSKETNSSWTQNVEHSRKSFENKSVSGSESRCWLMQMIDGELDSTTLLRLSSPR